MYVPSSTASPSGTAGSARHGRAEIPGYSVVRELAGGRRARCVIAARVVPAGLEPASSQQFPPEPDRPPPGVGAEIRTVVLKLPESEGRVTSAHREIAALERAQGDHVVRLLDAGRHASGRPMLVLERLGRVDLATLLGERAALQLGEAVTILAPLARAIERLHRSGVSHGALSPAHVLFSELGAPTLIGFGSAELFDPGLPAAELARVPGVTADRAALLALAHSVLAQVSGTRSTTAVARILREIDAAEPELLGPVLDRALFAHADPLPVRFDDPLADAPHLGRAVPTSTPLSDEPATSASLLAAWGIPAWADSIIVSCRKLIAAVRRGPSSGRGPLMLGAGVAIGLLVLALLVLPESSDDSRRSGDAAEREHAAQSAEDAEPSGSGTELADVDDVGVIPRDQTEPTPLTDDPVDAARELLTARESCIDELSLLCLDAVNALDGPAQRADRALLIGEGGADPLAELDHRDARFELIERLGDSALIAVRNTEQPVSLHLMRSDTGWRIREIYLVVRP